MSSFNLTVSVGFNSIAAVKINLSQKWRKHLPVKGEREVGKYKGKIQMSEGFNAPLLLQYATEAYGSCQVLT
ncbi:hypothetical protein OKW21_001386 [Catalinimonas alkaloidigena]|uniref:hypothetical protein n=1 Tax=Catalinimonas alkaloidigena TaxID=1075417 RepID=UPI002405C710|nr:hypothetical protein [Catalinimonas alkaloidigena]MDF9796123.1 hypothetical protein [Catalinimonas alkaloidigena]